MNQAFRTRTGASAATTWNGTRVMAAANLRVVISGGPGSGKTALVDALSVAGHRCCEEASRKLIREQHACGGAWLPWRDLPGFAAECERRMREQLMRYSGHAPVFFDRGLPDIIAYLRDAGLRPDDRLFQCVRFYTPLAFLAPPWPEIYRQDPERPQTYDEAARLYGELERAYRECGFAIALLPRAPVPERVAFVERSLAVATAASSL
jgi:predicted ATPase